MEGYDWISKAGGIELTSCTSAESFAISTSTSPSLAIPMFSLESPACLGPDSPPLFSFLQMGGHFETLETYGASIGYPSAESMASSDHAAAKQISLVVVVQTTM